MRDSNTFRVGVDIHTPHEFRWHVSTVCEGPVYVSEPPQTPYVKCEYCGSEQVPPTVGAGCYSCGAPLKLIARPHKNPSRVEWR